MLYYLATYPETVRSLLTEGVLPPKLPSWLNIDKISCFQKLHDCQSLKIPRKEQTFILALNLPSSMSTSQKTIILQKMEVSWVKEIYVSSQRSSNLFNKLVANHPFNLIIEPEFFIIPSSPIKRPRDTAAEEKISESMKPNSSSNQIMTQLPEINTLVNVENSIKANAETVFRISSYEEHLSLLELVFRYAQKSILITSFSLNQETLEKAKFFQLISRAVKRHVRIYIYYNDQKYVAPDVITFLNEHNVSFDYAYTHSKLLVMDRKLIATGSCNWLSMINSKFPESAEGSLIIQGDCNDLIEDIWDHLKFYRNLQFDNGRAINKFLKNPDNDCRIIYDIDNQNQIGYIPSLNEHLDFLQETFEIAKHRIIICSPFISGSRSYQKDFYPGLIRQTLNKGVEIIIVSMENSPHYEDLKQYLSQFNSKKIQLVACNYIHLKTVIVDHDLIADSSFNWLSASRSENSDFHNHEQTFFIQGPKAKKLIDQFLQGRVGLAIEEGIKSNEQQETRDKKAKISEVNNSVPAQANIFSTMVGNFFSFFSGASLDQGASRNSNQGHDTGKLNKFN